VLSIEISEEDKQDCINLSTGLFYPLEGFVNEENFNSIVNHNCLISGKPFTIPISLALEKSVYDQARVGQRIILNNNNRVVGQLEIDDKFIINDHIESVQKIYQTDSMKHPGVAKELKAGKFRVGGKVELDSGLQNLDCLDPVSTKKIFNSYGWKTVAGFQTRNPIHMAHEHLQRIALEICDGLFINPLVGWKKTGDFSEEAVNVGYQAMLKHYYHGLNVHYALLRTPMRYAGPREAIFHAIIRRNLGCTHFIIGRDHAGIGKFYDKYEAQDFALSLSQKFNLGIELLLLKEPFPCNKCNQMVTEATCAHEQKHRGKISGTLIRHLLSKNIIPPNECMREEVSRAIITLGDAKFVQEN
tara:strand:+ start:873 stop:1946 length:1074 start_codon:yes stop_codon:yes gene_type:complete